MLERFYSKNFYSFVVKIRVPWKNKFNSNLEETKDQMKKFKQELFSKSNEKLKENVILKKFIKNPFKDCKYDEIGIINIF